jgi:hypothetical protein
MRGEKGVPRNPEGRAATRCLCAPARRCVHARSRLEHDEIDTANARRRHSRRTGARARACAYAMTMAEVEKGVELPAVRGLF